MTDYRVNWPPHLRDRVLEFLTRAAAGTGREMAALNRALAEVEDLLRRTPAAAGGSRTGNLRA